MPLGEEVDMGGWSARFFRKQTEFYKVSLPLRSWLRNHVREFDAVHIHAVFSFASLAAGRVCSALGVPYIVRPLGVLNRWGMENRRKSLKALSFRLLDLPMLQKAAAIHFTSRLEMEEASRLGLSARLAVIPIGMDLAPFEKLPPSSVFSEHFPETAAARNLLFLSRLDPKKGLDLLISAFAAIGPRHQDAQLVICGDGDPAFVESLKAHARSLGISERITWAGQLGGDLRLAAFAAAELFVLPSHSENFGIALLEAMAAGLPCISTNQVALAADASRENAVRIAGRNPEAISEALCALLDSGQEREQLAAAARLFIRRSCSLDSMGASLHQLYQDVIRHAA